MHIMSNMSNHGKCPICYHKAPPRSSRFAHPRRNRRIDVSAPLRPQEFHLRHLEDHQDDHWSMSIWGFYGVLFLGGIPKTSQNPWLSIRKLSNDLDILGWFRATPEETSIHSITTKIICPASSLHLSLSLSWQWPRTCIHRPYPTLTNE